MGKMNYSELSAELSEEELREIAGFLNCGDVKNRLTEEILLRLLRYMPEDRTFLPAYRERSILTGKRIRYEADGVSRTGTVSGITGDFALLVRRPDGTCDTLISGSPVLLESASEPFRP